MNGATFSADMPRLRQVTIWTTALLVVLAPLAALIAYLRGAAMANIIQAIAIAGLVLCALLLLTLWASYMRQPEAREKRRLLGALQKVEAQVETVQAGLADALQSESAARDHARAVQEQAQKQFDGVAATRSARLDELRRAQQQELDKALQGLRLEHIENGLRAVPLDPAHVPGIGEVLAQQLHVGGVRTAYDVSPDAVTAIPGFGESKLLSLMSWREAEERRLVDSQPPALPDEQHSAIDQRYAQLVAEVHEEEAAALRHHQQAMDELRAQEAQALAAAGAQEETARQQLATLVTERQTLREQAAQYTGITMRAMLLHMLGGDNGWRGRLATAAVTLLFIAAGLLHLIMLIWSLVATRA